MRNWLTLLALAALLFISTRVQAELPPGSYDTLRVEAPEALLIEILGVKKAAKGNATEVVAVARVLRTVGTSFQQLAVVATREAELRAELSRVPEAMATVPTFAEDVHDVRSLARIGECLLGAPLPSARVRADAGAGEAEHRPR